MQITDSIEEDQGKYECVAENGIGTEYSHFTMLYVKGKISPGSFDHISMAPPLSNPASFYLQSFPSFRTTLKKSNLKRRLFKIEETVGHGRGSAHGDKKKKKGGIHKK